MIAIVAFYKVAYEDYNRWEETDKKVFRRIKDLIKDISRTPFEGIGKRGVRYFGQQRYRATVLSTGDPKLRCQYNHRFFRTYR